MDVHVKILGVLHAIFGGLGMLVGLVVFPISLIVAFAALDRKDEAAMLIPVIGLVVSGILVALSAPGFLAGLGLLRYRNWARVMVIILSVFDLFSIPFGTALAIYGLWVLLHRETGELFASGGPNVNAYDFAPRC